MSLLRTAARASVATRVIGSTSRRQQQRWAAQDAAAAQAAPVAAPVAPATTIDAPAAPAFGAPAVPVPAPAGVGADGTSTLLDQLERLGQLRAAGVLTDAEFETQKQRILAAG